MRTTVFTLFAMAAMVAAAPADPSQAAATVAITNAHLVAACFDGKPAAASTRRWTVAGPVSMSAGSVAWTR